MMNESDMSLYQLGVSTGIEEAILNYSKNNKDKFKKLWTEYEHRIDVLIKVDPDWKETYTQIMLNAYKGIIQKYSKEE